VRTIPHQGRIIVNGGEESLRRVLARGCWSEVERFAHWPNEAAVVDTGSDWTIAMDGAIKLGGAPQGVLDRFALIGRHNQLNALAAIGAARHVGVPCRKASPRWRHFADQARLELLGTVGGVTVTTISRITRRHRDHARRLRRASAAARIFAVLEPRPTR
jgi:UDP-N-acetylmuramate: L-alanyl-gamma-D-glutamyl-meso-diaminopimelate ligase